VVNSFLQMVEQDQSDSLVVAATNHVNLLDQALFRRFDDVIEYALPDVNNINLLLRAKLVNVKKEARFRWGDAARKAYGLSYADIVKATEEAIKTAIIDERTQVTSNDLLIAIGERTTTTGDKHLN